MFDLTVLAKAGLWLLFDDEAGELGAFGSQAEALRAAGEHEAAIGDEIRYVLVQDTPGEWEEAIVEPPRLH